MYTQFDKAIVVVIMSVVQLANVFGFHWGLQQDTVTEIVGGITPILAYLVPNKIPKDK
jgi:hypothetical protein